MAKILGNDNAGRKIKRSITSKKKRKLNDKRIKQEIDRVKPAKFSLAQLRNNTPSNIAKNSKDGKCRQSFLGRVKKPGNRYSYVYQTGCSGRPHLSIIEMKSTKIPQKSPVKVNCSCEYFVYTLEIVNADAGISENKFALPQWPVLRNPGGSKHLCKHLYKAAPAAIERAKGGKGRGMSEQKVKTNTDKAYRKSRAMKKKGRRY